MNLKTRYKKLSLWNKISFWGSIASIIGLVLFLSFPSNSDTTNQALQIDNSDINKNIIETQNNYYYNKDSISKTDSKKNGVSLGQIVNTDKEEVNIAESKDQVSGITANNVNLNNTNKDKETKIIQSNHVTSINQKGGITANEVIIYEKEPEPSLEETLTNLFNKINPEIINLLKKNRSVHVFITQMNLIKLKDIEDKLKERNFIELIDEGCTMIGFGVGPQGCLYDVNQTQSTYSNLFTIRALRDFK
jgi:hypothetical protein